MTKAAGSSERRPRDIDRSRRQHLAAQAADAAQITEDFETGQLAGTAAAPMAESAPPAPSTTPGPNDPGSRRAAQRGPMQDGPSPEQRATGNGKASYAGKAVTVYFASEEDRDRVQAAFAARGGIEGFTSASAWMSDVILERAEQWENDHNGGRGFTEIVAQRRRRRRRTSQQEAG